METQPEESPQAPAPIPPAPPPPTAIAPPTLPPPSPPAWVSLKDDELLGFRICDLGLRIEGSELEAYVRQLRTELTARGVTFFPDCYLGDEWFSPPAFRRSQFPSTSRTLA